MFCHRSFSCRFLALIVLLLPPAAAAAGANVEVVERAMRDELERSMRELRLEGLDRPYFISYRIEDRHVVGSSAVLGSLVRRLDSRHRTLVVEVRLGDYQRDNTNFFSFPSFGTSRIVSSFGGATALPLDDDYIEIRRQIWLATDAAYKNAVETLAKKRAALTSRARPQTLPDFSRGEVIKVDATTPLPEIDVAWGDGLATRLSALLCGMRHLYQSKVTYETTHRHTRYVNSEGTRYSRTASDTFLAATAATQTEDGTLLEDAVTVFGRHPEDLPPPAELTDRINAMGHRLAQRLAAQQLQHFNGPVLFEAEAAAELLAQVFVPKLLAQRRPVTGSEHVALLGGSGQSFESRLGGRVLPPFLSLVDDPTATEHAGKALYGGYQVDDEGVVAQPTRLVERGSLETLLVGRTPVFGAETSSGNQRAGGVAPSNLIFKVEQDGMTSDRLRRELLALVNARKAEFGVLVRRLGNPFFGPPDRPLSRMRLISAGGSDVGPVMTAVRIYPDGHEELVRNVVVAGISAQSFREIVAVSKELQVIHRPFRSVAGNPFGPGSFTNEVPLISIVSPALLFEDLVVRIPDTDNLQPPLITPPAFDAIGGAKAMRSNSKGVDMSNSN